MTWQHFDQQKRHTQDGCQLAFLAKKIPHGGNIKALEVGCGDGIVIHELLRLHKVSTVVGIDISTGAIKAAQMNLKDFLQGGRVTLQRRAARAFFKQRSHWDAFNRFIINPPFFAEGSGRPNKNKLDQLARHEGSLNLALWAWGAGKVLRTGGDLYCVFPTERLAECLTALRTNLVEPKELWWFKEDQRKRRFFLRAVRGSKPGLKVNFDF